MHLLVIASTVVNGILALMMVLFYLSYKTFPGFGRWTLGGGLVAVGYLMIVLRGILPVSLAIVVQNFAFSLTAIVYLSGMRMFLGLTDMPRGWYALPVVSALFSGFSVFWFDSAAWRMVVVSLTFSAPHFVTAFLILTDYPKTRSLFSLVIGTEMALMSGLLIVWAIWTLSVPDYQIFMVTPIHSCFFISLMALQIVITVSFIMLNTERFNRDLLISEEALKQIVKQLEKSLAEVRTLQGLLPICSNCKKIRDDGGEWVQVELYVRDRTDAEFSHSVCPECAEKLYPEFYKDN